MECRQLFEKKLCMTELQVEHAVFARMNYFEAVEGRRNSSFIYIVKGSVTLNAMGQRLSADMGSLLYIPEGQRYNAVWQGMPEIEYYAFHIISKTYDLTNTDRYEIQRVDQLSDVGTGALFKTVYELFATEERIAKVRAIGMYYHFYADVLPHLRAVPSVKYNTALLAAIAYIEQNYSMDFDMGTLASVSCISESRLYHLFREELATTPVRFRNEIRVERAAQALRTGDDSIEDIATSHGFHSTIYFREIFKGITGMTPSEYRFASRNPEKN